MRTGCRACRMPSHCRIAAALGESAVLVIEVASESLRVDRRVKAALYARAGIPEYWIVDVEGQTIEAFSGPDAERASYGRARLVSSAET
jgi:Uma2 family endonuclease